MRLRNEAGGMGFPGFRSFQGLAVALKGRLGEVMDKRKQLLRKLKVRACPVRVT